MRQAFNIIIFCLLIFLVSCHVKQSKHTDFDYDPTVPYPILNAGDFWPDKFDQRGLQNAVIFDDKIYCNTIDVVGKNNFLYCLNPINGLVIWRAPVKAFATQPVFLQGDRIVYCSYVGDIVAFNRQGVEVWQTQFDFPYGGHWVDTTNARLLVKTVYWKDVCVYDIKSGALISKIKSDSLQSLIDAKMKNSYPMEKHEYQFKRMGERYILKCRMDELGEYKIEITTANVE